MGEMSEWQLEQGELAFDDPMYQHQSEDVSCKFCGQRGLYWVGEGTERGKPAAPWRLYESDTGKKHDCGKLPKEERKEKE